MTDDRRAERDAILARERGWEYGDWLWHEALAGEKIVTMWRDPMGMLQDATPDMHSFDVLAEVLRGMSDRERIDLSEAVHMRVVDHYLESHPGWADHIDKVTAASDYEINVLLIDIDDLAEAICRVVEER